VGAIRQAVPLVRDPAVIASSVLMVKAPAAQMKTTLAVIAEFDAEIEAMCAVNRDFALIEELAGRRPELRRATDRGIGFGQRAVAVSRRVGATLRHRAGHRAEREELPGEVALLLPEVPAPELPRVRGRVGEALVPGRSHYDGQRAKGKDHQAATRAPAFKWIRIIYRCWQTRTSCGRKLSIGKFVPRA
jgi:hypothetical protein